MHLQTSLQVRQPTVPVTANFPAWASQTTRISQALWDLGRVHNQEDAKHMLTS